MSPRLDPDLLDLLACPVCRSPLRAEPAPGQVTGQATGRATGQATGELVCTGCGLAYPVREGIPVLLVDEARRPAP